MTIVTILSFKQPSGSPYHTILPIDSKSNQTWNLATQLKQILSNSWSDSLDDCLLLPALYLQRSSILGDSQKYVHDCYKRVYAEMLFRWGLLVPRAKILKYLSSTTDVFRDVEFVTECPICAKITMAPSCKDCHKPLLHCSLCRLPVKGLASACLACGHGGHMDHMQKWFEVSVGDELTAGGISHLWFLFGFRKTRSALRDAAVSA